jgi:hypothetical protein
MPAGNLPKLKISGGNWNPICRRIRIAAMLMLSIGV